MKIITLGSAPDGVIGVPPIRADKIIRESEFERCALRFDHDISALDRGEVQTSFPFISDIDMMKVAFIHSYVKDRVKRQAAFDRFKNRARLWQGVHDRGEAWLFADKPLVDKDVSNVAKHFPAHLKVVSVKNLELGEGVIIDVGHKPQDWNVGDTEDLYVILNVENLTIHNGASLQVRGNICSFLIQSLRKVLDGQNTISSKADIAILPTVNPVDSGIRGPLDGPEALPGERGADGLHGQLSKVIPSPFGPVVLDMPSQSERSGKNGTDGTDGQRGRRGRTGGMCKTAEITIRSFAPDSAPITIFSQAGRGGNGGKGGAGGDGGNGGMATTGLYSDLETFPHGTPGNGGNGGNGGKGGCGGNGGISANIFVNCPPEQIHLINGYCLDSKPGAAGEGGPGGKGGNAGKLRNVLGKIETDLNSTPGKYGQQGDTAIEGRSRRAVSIYLNEVLLTGE